MEGQQLFCMVSGSIPDLTSIPLSSIFLCIYINYNLLDVRFVTNTYICLTSHNYHIDCTPI